MKSLPSRKKRCAGIHGERNPECEADVIPPWLTCCGKCHSHYQRLAFQRAVFERDQRNRKFKQQPEVAKAA
jgi:hypothetical protein